MHFSIPTLAAAAMTVLAGAASAQDGDAKTLDPPFVKDPAAEHAPPAGGPREPGHREGAPAARLAQGFHPLRTGVVHGVDEPAGLTAASRRWKARFAPEGTSFVPWFGSEKPRSLPLTFRLESVVAGGFALQSVGGTVRRQGERVAIGRGAVEEVWHLAEEGVEQTFVLAERTAPGEILMRISFEGEYEAALDDEGILFSSELGEIRYGRAFAFDAAGLRTDVAQTLDGRSIVLTVPDAFVAKACFPITIDPWIETYGVEAGLHDCILPDVAYEWSSGNHLYVYVHVFSQSDHDLYSVLANDAGIIESSRRVIDASVVSWTRPRVAGNLDGWSFLVVAEVGAPGSREVRGRLVDAPTAHVGPEIHISAGPIGEHVRPDVGGDPNAGAGRRFCVVWERVFSPTDRDVAARMIDPVNGSLSPVLWLDNSAQTLDGKPAIAKSCGNVLGGTPHWTVVWERVFSPEDRDVYAAQIAWDGSLYTPKFPIHLAAHDDFDPAVSTIADGTGVHRPYLVAWSRTMPSGKRDVVLQGMVGPEMHATVNLSQGMPLAAEDDGSPRVETDGHLFGVAFTKSFGPTLSDVWVDWVSFAGGQIARVGTLEVVAGPGLQASQPALGSRHSGGASSRRFALAHALVVSGQSDIQGVILDAPVAVPFVSLCIGREDLCPCGQVGNEGGCANSVNPMGALLAASGIPNVSADTLVLATSGMPANAVCVFLQGTALVNADMGLPFGDGLRCVGGSVVRLAIKNAPAGSASFPEAGDPKLSVKGSLPALGGLRYYQVWYRDPASFCTGDHFNLTNGLQVVWLP